jgi:hypothetical protein
LAQEELTVSPKMTNFMRGALVASADFTSADFRSTRARGKAGS